VEPPRRCASADEQVRCLQHDVTVNVYCRDCQSLGCLLCADQQNTHAGHDVLTLPHAAQYFKVHCLLQASFFGGRGFLLHQTYISPPPPNGYQIVCSKSNYKYITETFF